MIGSGGGGGTSSGGGGTALVSGGEEEPQNLGVEGEEKRFDVEEVVDHQSCWSRYSWSLFCCKNEAQRELKACARDPKTIPCSVWRM